MLRIDGRGNDNLRDLTITRGVNKYAEGSCRIEMGDTIVYCTATVEDRVPHWMMDSQQGWVTADYGMLPRSTHQRSVREGTHGQRSGRSLEIERLIGRSLRAVADLHHLGRRTIHLDCDVLQADGGTRTAAITGAYVALAEACGYLREKKLVKTSLLRDQVAAISLGLVAGELLLDLCYEEDTRAAVDIGAKEPGGSVRQAERSAGRPDHIGTDSTQGDSYMEYRKLGPTDMEVSVIGFGCWAMGKWWWGDDVVDQQSIAAVHRAVDLGINFFDTADVYGSGHSEQVLGQALRGHRDEVFVATKGGRYIGADDMPTSNVSKEYLLQACEASLKRLGTDYIDLYQVHWPDEENTAPEESMAAMVELQEAGKIRYIGVSNYNVEQMKKSMAIGQLVSLQPQYNMLDRHIEEQLLPFCRENGIGVLCYSPMARGLLTGKYDENATFPETDHRSRHPAWQGEQLRHNVEAVRRMAQVAEEAGKTMAQLAVAWVLSQPGVTCALCGAKRPDQIAETAGAAGWQLTAEQLVHIDRILKETGAG